MNINPFETRSRAALGTPALRSTPTWTAMVRQEGLADRRLPVVQAFS